MTYLVCLLVLRSCHKQPQSCRLCVVQMSEQNSFCVCMDQLDILKVQIFTQNFEAQVLDILGFLVKSALIYPLGASLKEREENFPYSVKRVLLKEQSCFHFRMSFLYSYSAGNKCRALKAIGGNIAHQKKHRYSF